MKKTTSKPTAVTKAVRATTVSDVARIQSIVAKENGGAVPKKSYVGRMQKVVAQRGTRLESK